MMMVRMMADPASVGVACVNSPDAERAAHTCDDRCVTDMSPIGLDHVQVAAPAGSEDEARRFYGELLGMAEVRKPDALHARGGVWFAGGGHQLHVGIAEPFAPATKAHPALLVRLSELDRLAQRLEVAGCDVLWDDAIPGTRRFFTTDPWGNRIELVGVEDR
jgi:catechol 2,3-dioxygenase-like lactoylglutathione lyase family enzyme